MSIIVLPTDFSVHASAAIPWALRMADSLDAQIHCLYIVRDTPYYEGLDVILAESLPTTDGLLSGAKLRLAAHVQSAFPDHADRIVPVVEVGTPFVQIVRYAREKQAEMIVISTHGHTGLKHVLLGSTTEAVVRHAECAVLSVRTPALEFEKP
jgi:nucleotide-binding universal stress UspA family protein